MSEQMPDWDAVYDGAPPWDIGRPQPAFLRLAEAGLLAGRVLDAGCGTGEHTILAARQGADASGVDISRRAIEIATRKAAERGVDARFLVASVLALDALGECFDVVIDSGVVHVFGDDDRARYVASLRSAVNTGGTCYLMCFSEHVPGDWGPRRVRQAELEESFAEGWSIASIDPAEFEIAPGMPVSVVSAWLATICRT
jgi:cyclopropane fatty-acyl-phospholipid synthase-like methyltransferase